LIRHRKKAALRVRVWQEYSTVREKSKSEVSGALAADRRRMGTICAGRLPAARLDTGVSDTDLWVVRVSDRLLGLDCAADEPPVRSGSGEDGCGRSAGREERGVQASRVPDRGQRIGLEAGGNAPLRNRAEKGAWICPSCQRYLRAVASRMSRTRVHWLATKSAWRMVTWQEAKPCTGIRLSPNRSRTLLRLSAQLRRP
jgi:hypothetical protein